MSNLHIPRTMGHDDVHVVRTCDGSDTLYNRVFDATYHSLKGAVGESRHVFVQNGLQAWKGSAPIHILEFGFGTGLNAFLAYLFSKKHNTAIHYTGIESFSIDPVVASQLNYPAYLAADADKVMFNLMHTENRATIDSFNFLKIKTLQEVMAPPNFDIIFFDAFSPDIQPEWWTQDNFSTLYNMMGPGGMILTYCAQGEVRRRMERAGFTMQRIPGAPGKRHMLRGLKSG